MIMKKKNIVSVFTIAVFSAGILMSCSKQELLVEEQPSTATGTAVAAKPVLSTAQTGTITGKISPVGKRMLWLYDATGRQFGPYSTDNLTGTFRITDIPAGNYKLVIEYPGTSTTSTNDIQLATTTIAVEVRSGQMTDVGTIRL
jgi:hypothetical protein